MHDQSFFFQAFVYLLAAVLMVPVAKRLGLGSVLGYLAAGVIIGPTVLGFIGADGQDVMEFAEFGVVIMLFLVGLELQPRLIWRLRTPILGLGGLQVAVTAVALAAIGLGLGLPWQSALAVGAIMALSSTAMVLQTLNEKGLSRTPGGENAFSSSRSISLTVREVVAPRRLWAKPPYRYIALFGHYLSWWVRPALRIGAVAAAVAPVRKVTNPRARRGTSQAGAPRPAFVT